MSADRLNDVIGRIVWGAFGVAETDSEIAPIITAGIRAALLNEGLDPEDFGMVEGNGPEMQSIYHVPAVTPPVHDEPTTPEKDER